MGLAALAGGLLLFAAPHRAFAHADVTSANPAPNAVVRTGVSQVVLTFSEPVTLVQPGITVSNGSQTITTTAALNGATVTATLATPIGAGTYDVTYAIRAADGDEQTATYSFSIAAGVPAPAPTAGTATPGSTTTTGAGTSTTNELIQPRDASTTTTAASGAKTSTAKARNWLVYVLIAGGIVIIAIIIGTIARLVRKRR